MIITITAVLTAAALMFWQPSFDDVRLNLPSGKSENSQLFKHLSADFPPRPFIFSPFMKKQAFFHRKLYEYKAQKHGICIKKGTISSY